jgi:hypothetical protein
MESLPLDSYSQFLGELKSRIQAAQLRASLAVNRELVMLYWRRSVAIFWIGRTARVGVRK